MKVPATQIREARQSDAGQVASIYRPWVERTAVSFELEPPPPEEMARRIATLGSYAPWLVCEGAEGILGYSYASRHRDRAAYQWSVDSAVYVRGDLHRRGVGRALYTSLFALLRLQGFVAAHGGITLPNSNSEGLHRAMGFRFVGVYPAVGFKLGAWHDVGWWQLRLKDSPPQPRDPLALAQARGLPGWKEALASGAAGLR